ncbi:unnamed protein product, partial [Rotaria sordida]
CLNTIASTTSDEEENVDESDQASLLPRAINNDDIDIYVSTETQIRHDFDIVEKVEMNKKSKRTM